MHIARFSTQQNTLTLTNSLGTTAEVSVRGFASGMLYVPGGSPLTAITWYAAALTSADADNGTPAANPHTYAYLPVQDGSGAALTNTTLAPGSTGCAVAIPAACMAAGGAKLLGTFSSGTSGSLDISLKG